MTQPLDEKGWNELAYKWARYLQINWYHAVDDLRQLREWHGDKGAFDHVKLTMELNK